MAVALGAVTAACGVFTRETSRQMVPASSEPQTEATVRVHPGDNGMNVVTITANDVAPPEEVATGATTYVVWIRPPASPAANVGILRVDAGRRGLLQTTTPYDRFTVIITAERALYATAPLGRAVFTMGVNAR